MSDVTDSLNIIANMFNTVADYELKDSQFKQSLEHQEFLEDKKEDAQLEKLNIEMNLSNLREKNKEVKVLIRDRLDKANAANLNVSDIIKLDPKFITQGGSAVSSTAVDNSLKELTRTAEVGNYIGLTMDNQKDALEYNEFVLSKLDLLLGISTKMTGEVFNMTVDAGEDAILSIEDYDKAVGSLSFFDPTEKEAVYGMTHMDALVNFEERYETDTGKKEPKKIEDMPSNWQEEAKEIETLYAGKDKDWAPIVEEAIEPGYADDPLTKFIDESQFGETIYGQAARDRIIAEGQQVEALSLQIQYQESKRDIEENKKKRAEALKVRQRKAELHEVAGLKFVQQPLLNPDGSIKRTADGKILYDEGRNRSAEYIEKNATDDWLIYPVEGYEAPTAAVDLINDPEYRADVFKNQIGKALTGSLSFLLESVTELKVIDPEWFGSQYANIMNAGQLAAVPKDASWETEEEIINNMNIIESKLAAMLVPGARFGTSKSGITIKDEGIFPKWGLWTKVHTELGDEWKNLMKSGQLYSQYDEDGNLISRGIVEFIMGYDKDGFKNTNLADKSAAHGGVDQDAIDMMDLGPALTSGPTVNWLKLYNVAQALEHIKDIRQGYKDYLPQRNPLLELGSSVSLTRDIKDITDQEYEKPISYQPDPDFGGKTTSKLTKDTLSFDDFVGSITDKFSAKVYSGAIAASTLSNAVRKYKKTPSPANREAVEALYNRYVK